MPLVQQTLNTQLVRAFDEAMKTYEEKIKESVAGLTKDGVIEDPKAIKPEEISKNAREAAAKTFADIATPAIDTYIKSATVTVTGTNAPGQITLVPVPPSPTPVPLPTTTPGTVTGQGVIS